VQPLHHGHDRALFKPALYIAVLRRPEVFSVVVFWAIVHEVRHSVKPAVPFHRAVFVGNAGIVNYVIFACFEKTP